MQSSREPDGKKRRRKPDGKQRQLKAESMRRYRQRRPQAMNDAELEKNRLRNKRTREAIRLSRHAVADLESCVPDDNFIYSPEYRHAAMLRMREQRSRMTPEEKSVAREKDKLRKRAVAAAKREREEEEAAAAAEREEEEIRRRNLEREEEEAAAAVEREAARYARYLKRKPAMSLEEHRERHEQLEIWRKNNAIRSFYGIASYERRPFDGSGFLRQQEEYAREDQWAAEYVKRIASQRETVTVTAGAES
jgi:hypothetical protein